MKSSICESLFDEVHTALCQPRSYRVPHAICHATRRTYCDRHGANAVPDFLFDECCGLRAARVHLHGLATAFDAALGARDEQLDAQALLTALHAEDLVHPRAHPLEALGRGHRPDEDDFLRRGDAVVVAVNEVLHVHDLVGDANTTCKEDDSAVRIEAVVSAVWSFDEAECAELLVGALACLLVHLAGETCACAADEADLAGLLGRTGGHESLAF